jgi:hypothetical protein
MKDTIAKKLRDTEVSKEDAISTASTPPQRLSLLKRVGKAPLQDIDQPGYVLTVDEYGRIILKLTYLQGVKPAKHPRS